MATGDTHEHTPVLLEAAMTALAPRDGGCYADCTFGRGGHTAAILERSGPAARVVALDRDPDAIAAGQTLAADPRLTLLQRPFDEIGAVAEELGLAFDGVLFDLGVSSPQIDEPRRGFSFRFDGPLDMRMDPTRGESAAEWLARATRDDIARVLRELGEERFAGRIATAIVAARGEMALDTTRRLAELVASAMPARARRDAAQHPATRTFQALRIHINDELGQLDRALEQVVSCLRPRGRIAVISFHSLEDRRVKRFFRALSSPPRPSRHLPLPPDAPAPKLRLWSKAVRASDEETARNPRARSAVMRTAERLP